MTSVGFGSLSNPAMCHVSMVVDYLNLRLEPTYAYSIKADVSVLLRSSLGWFKIDWAKRSRVSRLSRRLLFEQTIRSIKDKAKRVA